MDVKRGQCHPLLSGKREGKYQHGMSVREMEVMTSLCETYFPSLSGELVDKNDELGHIDVDAVRSFYEASGSQYPLPDEVIYLTANQKYIKFLKINKEINNRENCIWQNRLQRSLRRWLSWRPGF